MLGPDTIPPGVGFDPCWILAFPLTAVCRLRGALISNIEQLVNDCTFSYRIFISVSTYNMKYVDCIM